MLLCNDPYHVLKYSGFVYKNSSTEPNVCGSERVVVLFCIKTSITSSRKVKYCIPPLTKSPRITVSGIVTIQRQINRFVHRSVEFKRIFHIFRHCLCCHALYSRNNVQFACVYLFIQSIALVCAICDSHSTYDH